MLALAVSSPDRGELDGHSRIIFTHNRRNNALVVAPEGCRAAIPCWVLGRGCMPAATLIITDGHGAGRLTEQGIRQKCHVESTESDEPALVNAKPPRKLGSVPYGMHRRST